MAEGGKPGDDPKGGGKGGAGGAGDPDPKGGAGDPDPKGGEADPEAGGDGDPEGGPPKDINYWKRRSRDNEKRARDNADAAKQLREIQDKDKTETEKRTTAERERDEAHLEAMRLRVGMRKGLTEAQARRLIGRTEEDLEKDADELLETFRKKDDDGGEGKPRPAGRPRERLRSGNAPAGGGEEDDPKKIADRVLSRPF